MRNDTTSRYGTVSRALHWAMAACYLLMFATALAWNLNEALKSLITLHKAAGLLLLLLALVRFFWALTHFRQRPAGGVLVKGRASGAVCVDACRPGFRHGAAISWCFWQRAWRARFRFFPSHRWTHHDDRHPSTPWRGRFTTDALNLRSSIYDDTHKVWRMGQKRSCFRRPCLYRTKKELLIIR